MPRASRSIEKQNLINEKSPQRYIFENIACGNSDVLRKFFTEKAFNGKLKKKIKVIIPEFPVPYTTKGKIKQHNTDFRVIYKDGSYHNIEVEWKTSDFSSHGKDVYEQCYANDKGFIIVLEDNLRLSYVQREDIKQIKAEEFSAWFMNNAKSIVDGTISNRIESYQPRSRKYWIIYLGKSEKNYINKARKSRTLNKKWAFRYTNRSEYMKSILDIKAGDIVVFTYGFEYLNGTKARSIWSHTDWKFTGIDIARVTNGYYCDFKDRTFENDNWTEDKITEKQFMHYFDFKLPMKSTDDVLYKTDLNNRLIKFPTLDAEMHEGWKGVIDKLRLSASNQCAPIQLSENEFNSIYFQLSL